MKILLERSNEKFVVDQELDFAYLSPIANFVLSKLKNNQWDDYNELYHAVNFLENLKRLQRGAGGDTFVYKRSQYYRRFVYAARRNKKSRKEVQD